MRPVIPSAEAPRVKIESVERFERDVRLRLPFRFGVTTVTQATQAVIRARISSASSRMSSTSIAVMAKWLACSSTAYFTASARVGKRRKVRP